MRVMLTIGVNRHVRHGVHPQMKVMRRFISDGIELRTPVTKNEIVSAVARGCLVSCSQLTLAKRVSIQRRGGALHCRRPPPSGCGLVPSANPRVLARLRLIRFLPVQGAWLHGRGGRPGPQVQADDPDLASPHKLNMTGYQRISLWHRMVVSSQP